MATLTANDLTLRAENLSAYPFIRWTSDLPFTTHDGVSMPAGQELAALTAHVQHQNGEKHQHVDLYIPNKAGVGKTTITVSLFQDPPSDGGANPTTSGKRQMHLGGYLFFEEGCPVLKSPDGNRWMLQISNTGVLAVTELPDGVYVPANKT